MGERLNYDLKTRPDDLNEIALPLALDSMTVNAWAANSIETHRSRMAEKTDPQTVHQSLDEFTARFDDAFVADVTQVLLWFSGKDILAAMADWLSTRNVANPGDFRASLRNWIIANPTRDLELLTEWHGLTEIFRT